MKNRISWLAAVAIAFGLGGCVHGGGGINAPEGWNVVKSKHYHMYTPTTYRVEDTFRALELQYANVSSGFFPGFTPEPIDVLFVEDTDYIDLFGEKRGAATALASVPGGGEIGKNGLVVARPAQKDESNDAINEAIAHIFIHRAFPKAPLWFHEGFATWMRNAMFLTDGGKAMACFGRPAYSRHSHIDLQKFFAMTWKEYDSEEGRGWYKYTAQVLFDYMFFGEGTKRRAAILPMVTAVSEGKPTDQVIKAAFPDLTIAQLDKAVVEHGKQLETEAGSSGDPRTRCPYAKPILADRAPDLIDPVTDPANVDQVKALVAAVKKLPKHREAYPPWFGIDEITAAEKNPASP